MEWKIGEIFEYNGEWYQCIMATCGCSGCAFQPDLPCNLMDKCLSERRSDYKSVIFKKLKKLGEPFCNGIFGLVQKYQLNIYGYSSKDKRVCFVDNYDVYIKIKQNKEDMEETKNAAEIINGINHGIEPMSSYHKDTEEKKVILEKLMYKYINGKITYKAFEKEVIGLYSNKGESKPTLKEFDLKAAKAGKPVCTRDGRKARIVCFDVKGDKPIIALIEAKGNHDALIEIVEGYFINGHSTFENKETDNDLMMLPERKEGWINLYNADTTFYFVEGKVYECKDEAIKEAKFEIENGQREKNEYVKTVKIDLEE